MKVKVISEMEVAAWKMLTAKPTIKDRASMGPLRINTIMRVLRPRSMTIISFMVGA